VKLGLRNKSRSKWIKPETLHLTDKVNRSEAGSEEQKLESKDSILRCLVWNMLKEHRLQISCVRDARCAVVDR